MIQIPYTKCYRLWCSLTPRRSWLWLSLSSASTMMCPVRLKTRSASTSTVWRWRLGGGSWSSPPTSWTRSSEMSGRISRPGARPRRHSVGDGCRVPVSCGLATLTRYCASHNLLCRRRSPHQYPQATLLSNLFPKHICLNLISSCLQNLLRIILLQIKQFLLQHGWRMQVVYLWNRSELPEHWTPGKKEHVAILVLTEISAVARGNYKLICNRNNPGNGFTFNSPAVTR